MRCGRPGYKHFAPPERKNRLSEVLCLRHYPVHTNLWYSNHTETRKDNMNRFIARKFLFAVPLLVLCAVTAPAQNAVTPASASQLSLQELVDKAAKTTLEKFKEKGLKDENLSITLIDLRSPQHPVSAGFRGNERIYPASVVKLFYLAAAHRWLEDKKIEDTPELRRALRDMIVDSSNEATQYVVDVLTHTTGGYELPPNEMKEWQAKRNVVNRYFASLKYSNINVNQKTFCEDAYGREKVSRGANGENRNKLTTEATGRLLAEIVTRQTVTPERSGQMMDLLKRDYSGSSKDADDQAHGFTAIALQGVEGARLWSKAGWTSTTRHDAAYLEMPDGSKFVLVTFTTDHANEREIIPTVAKVVIEGFRNVR
ncbi:MAG: Serine hydrolase [Acidobacteria bacterium]|nr:Serine hydrolase [Acidobacteriota bacterium]